MTTWTIRADEILDRLVEENVRKLGYTSKAELVREAVREFILKRNMGRLGLMTLNNQEREGEGIDPHEPIGKGRHGQGPPDSSVCYIPPPHRLAI